LGRFTGGGQVGAGAPPTTLIYELLDSHIAVAPEATYTFTPTTPLTIDDFKKFMIVISGDSTAAFALLMRFNGETGAFYSTFGYRIAGGAETIINLAAQTAWEVIQQAIIAANDSFWAAVEFSLPIAGINRVLPMTKGISEFGGGAHQVCGNKLTGAGRDTFTSITILTSASTWKTGTEIHTYGVTG